MKLVPDPEMTEWLENLVLGTEVFEWDEGNSSKNIKHGVVREDVESLLSGPVVFDGRIIEPATSYLLSTYAPQGAGKV